MTRVILKQTMLVGLVLVLFLGGTLIGGCAEKEATAPVPTPATSIAPTIEPVLKQKLVIGVENDDYKRGDVKSTVGLYPVNINFAEPLVKFGPNCEVLPNLATGWEFVGNNTWRFYLRKGVKFHDGREFTSEAVKYSLGRIAAQGGGLLKVGEGSVNIIDDYTVEITPTIVNNPPASWGAS